MARWNELSWKDDVYRVGSAWRERCFFKDMSLFTDSAIWTSENFSELKSLTLDQPIYDGQLGSADEVFIKKLKLQLVIREKASTETVQLAAELLSFIYLLSTNGTKLKADRIGEILSWHPSLKEINVDDHISPDAFRGIANPGPHFNLNIFKQWVYLVSTLGKWKSTTLAFRD